MKHDVFDVPLGRLREWSQRLDRLSDSDRLVFAGLQVARGMVPLVFDDDALLGRYVVVECFGTFDCERFGHVFLMNHVWVTEDDAQRYCDWADWVDADSSNGSIAHGFGYDHEIWHVVEDAPSGSCTSDALCPSDSVEDGSCADGLAPELPAMALEVIRQLIAAGELGDPDELTDDDFFDASCYTGELPLGVVGVSGSNEHVLSEIRKFMGEPAADLDGDGSDSVEPDIDDLMWDAGYFENPVLDGVPKHGYFYPQAHKSDWDFSFLDDDYWDERPAPAPVNTWQEIDIQNSDTAVLS